MNIINYKILLVGDCGIGKTSFSKKYVHDLFTVVYNPTIGVNYSEKPIIENGKYICLQLWDISGKELIGLYSRIYYRCGCLAMVMFDLSNRASFESTISWKNNVEKSCDNIPIILVANKSDIGENKYVIKSDELKLFSDRNGFLSCFIISVKNDDGIRNLMEFVVSLVLNNINVIDENNTNVDLVIDKNISLKKSYCY
jgi:small GTP-binding protein